MSEIVMASGNEPWLPSSRGSDLVCLEFYEVPRIGTYLDGANRYRAYQSIERHPDGHGIWAYVEISADEANMVATFDGDTDGAWDLIDRIFAGKPPTVAFALADRVVRYTAATDYETLSAAIVRLLRSVVEDRSSAPTGVASPVRPAPHTPVKRTVDADEAEIAQAMADLIDA